MEPEAYHKVHSEYEDLLVPVDEIKLLPNNWRRGDLPAIKASLDKFGLVKPIVCTRDDDGSLMVLAGNHTLMAARDLGWTHIACAVVEFADGEALQYALADNKISDLATNDQELLHEAVSSVVADELLYDIAFFDALHWDDLGLELLDSKVRKNEFLDARIQTGWVAPDLKKEKVSFKDFIAKEKESDDSGEEKPKLAEVEDEDSLVDTIITQGSPALGMEGSSVRLDYTLVFESPREQQKWFKFWWWLREQSGYEGNTMVQKLFAFLEDTVEHMHTEFRSIHPSKRRFHTEEEE